MLTLNTKLKCLWIFIFLIYGAEESAHTHFDWHFLLVTKMLGDVIFYADKEYVCLWLQVKFIDVPICHLLLLLFTSERSYFWSRCILPRTYDIFWLFLCTHCVRVEMVTFRRLTVNSATRFVPPWVLWVNWRVIKLLCLLSKVVSTANNKKPCQRSSLNRADNILDPCYVT